MSSVTVLIERSRLNPALRVVACLHCRAVVELHQPDIEMPDRLLGTCTDCKAWYLIDRERGIMASLPPDLTLRSA